MDDIKRGVSRLMGIRSGHRTGWILTFLLVTAISLLPDNAAHAQLRVGKSDGEINFRQGPGFSFKVLQTINASNLLVILPRETENGFVEAFDVESNSRGFVYENLIRITDTLNFGKQHFFEKSGESATGEVEVELVNGTTRELFVWVNKFSYQLAPREKRTLVLDEEEVIYFTSSPGLFPVFGKEFLQKGNTYRLNFSL